MKRINYLLRAGLFIIIVVVGTLAALWVGETTGLALADLSDVPIKAVTSAANTEVAYAAIGGEKSGIYRSEDEGHSWQRVSAGPQGIVTAVSVHPGNARVLYAGTLATGDAAESKLWYSDNGGRRWRATALKFAADESGLVPVISALTVSSNHPGLVLVGTEGQGLYQFHLNSGTYERIGGPSLSNLYVQDVVVGSDSRVYAITTEGLRVIEGAAWRSISTPDTAVSLAIDPSDPETIYIGTVAYGAYRSTDGGQSWEPINDGLGWQPGILLWVSAITVDPENPQHLVLTTAFGVGSHMAPDGLFESFNSGQSWKRTADLDTPVNRLSIKADGIYAATDNGLIRFGEPLPQAPPDSFAPLRSLIDPTGVQVLIMVLTLVLGSLVLIGRAEWVLKGFGAGA